MVDTGEIIEQTLQSEGSKSGDGDVDRKQIESKILELKKHKRAKKTAATKVRHNVEKLCALKNMANVEEIEKDIEVLWGLLDVTMGILEELCFFYITIDDQDNKKAMSAEADSFESEINECISKAQTVIKESMLAKASQSVSENIPAEVNSSSVQLVSELNSSSILENHGQFQSRLKPLELPVFDGNKTKFEDFWGLFTSLVDKNSEAANVKMARLRQSLTGVALQAIQGLGVSQPEYEEAKEILQAKYGGQRRQLQAYLDQLETMAPLKGSDLKSFEKFSDLVRVSVVKLQAEGRDSELGEGTFHSLLVKKLTDKQVESYSRWLGDQKLERSVLKLKDWLKEEVRIRVEAAEMVHGVVDRDDGKVDGGRGKFGGRGNGRTYFGGSGGRGSDEKPPCSFCAGNHGVWACRKFQGLNTEARWNIAKDKHLCFRCLGSDHQGRLCSRSKTCGIDGCKRNHHTLLHDTSLVKQSEDRTGKVPGEGAPSKHTHSSVNKEKKTETYSLRTVPVWLKANKRKIKINAILDDASNETFLNEEVAGVLGLCEKFETVKVHVLNNEVETFQSMPVKLTIESVDGQFAKEINVKTCPKKVTGNYAVEDWSQSKHNWEHLKNCEFAKPAKDGLIDLLIGVDNADLHYCRADIRGETGGPIARLGPLGWTCIGAPDTSVARTHVIRTLFSRDPLSNGSACCDVDRSIKRFWEVEACGSETTQPEVYTEEEKAALTQVKESLKYDITTRRYTVGVPWKPGRPKLPDNREQAMSRLCNTERKLKKDEFTQTEYRKTIESYIEKGYMKRVSEEETPPPEVWYLPHFPVVRMDKTSTKVRIVFDCSAQMDGVSLNDVIHAGPKLQQELFDVLIRFRRNPVALACDIKEMYMQVEIEEKDRPMFRILWRDCDGDRDPDVFEFSRVVFGKNAAPMECQFVAQENARRNRGLYPMAAETVLKSTYMDDSIDSVETEEEGIELYRQLEALWSLAGMQARKWISNSSKVVATTPEADRATKISLGDDKDPVIKALGLSWESKEDVLSISTADVPPNLSLTKRNVLKRIAAVFDPLGLVSPFVVVAKILLQELWTRGYDWDDEILDEIGDRILRWFQQLGSLGSLCVPRCLRWAMKVITRKIITFADASIQAYGAVVYLLCGYEDGTVSCRLIASKSKVAPLKTITVPRLELMGAILGLRLTQNICRVLQMPVQSVLFFSDSKDVLWWIRGRGRDFRSFVANRVGEIQMVTEPCQWQYVPTDQNPADLCTRGATPSELQESSLWWQGPVWLLEDQADWPKMEFECRPRQVRERKAVKQDVLGDNETLTFVSCQEKRRDQRTTEEWRLNPKRFSSWLRLVRLHARVRRVIDNMRNPKARQNSKELLPQEIRDAEEDIIQRAQREVFSDEYGALVKKKPIQHSVLSKLNPMLDEQGLMRSDSRLRYTEYLPYDVRFPILLPRGHWVTALIVKYYHELGNHAAGTNFVLSQISQRYWIVAAREEIRKWESQCNECKRRKNKVASQIMAPLPSSRTCRTFRAFDQAAVDYAGPIKTVQGRGKKRQKRWLCVFTCMATRAIHLEVAFGLDTDSFLNALSRFTSRRGTPSAITSDNGTNFVGAVNEIKELVEKLDKEKIQRATGHKGIKWNFNPPSAPHFGGVFESMVKVAKKALYAVLGTSDITDEELITACAGVESLVNSRPLTYQTADPHDDVPLTPNHFLHGQMGGQFAPENVDVLTFNPRKRWRRVQAPSQEFGHVGSRSTCLH